MGGGGGGSKKKVFSFSFHGKLQLELPLGIPQGRYLAWSVGAIGSSSCKFPWKENEKTFQKTPFDTILRQFSLEKSPLKKKKVSRLTLSIFTFTQQIAVFWKEEITGKRFRSTSTSSYICALLKKFFSVSTHLDKNRSQHSGPEISGGCCNSNAHFYKKLVYGLISLLIKTCIRVDSLSPKKNWCPSTLSS